MTRLILQFDVEVSADCANEEEAHLYAAAVMRFVRGIEDELSPMPLYFEITRQRRFVLPESMKDVKV